MKDKKILQEEVLSDEELEKVAGGTVSETIDIVMAVGKVSDKWGTNQRGFLCPESVARYLKERYGIDATLGGEFFDGGTVSGEANQYSRNGELLTHQQVMDIINHRGMQPEKRGRLTRCE